jgi:RND family efflux transporter MFP subunit
MSLVAKLLRVGITLVVVLVAIWMTTALWQRYMQAPWTRDGRVRAEIVDIAPEVSGTIVDIPVKDNAFVHKGDVLFTIDPVRFKLAIAQAQAQYDAAKEDLSLKTADAKRRQGLTGVVSSEEQERYKSTASVATAQLDAAQSALDIAKLNLERSVLHSPVNGYVTNLRLRVGDYALAGQARVALIDADSYWIIGYFEETKLRSLKIGDPARVKLIGYKQPLDAHVETIARGINEQNGSPDPQGLQDVNPIFTWVRLAQRIPVSLHIDKVPDDIVLAAGMTCTVAVGSEAGPRAPSGWLLDWIEEVL